MTPRHRQETSDGTVLVIVASTADAVALAPLARGRHSDRPAPMLVATGPEPMQVDLALDDAHAPAGRILLVDAAPDGPAHELARLLPRIDELLSDGEVGGVVVRGGSAAALAAAQCAVWRGVPVVHVPVADETGPSAASQAAVAELVSWQTSPAGGVRRSDELALRVHDALAPAEAPFLVAVGSERVPERTA